MGGSRAGHGVAGWGGVEPDTEWQQEWGARPDTEWWEGVGPDTGLHPRLPTSPPPSFFSGNLVVKDITLRNPLI